MSTSHRSSQFFAFLLILLLVAAGFNVGGDTGLGSHAARMGFAHAGQQQLQQQQALQQAQQQAGQQQHQADRVGVFGQRVEKGDHAFDDLNGRLGRRDGFNFHGEFGAMQYS